MNPFWKGFAVPTAIFVILGAVAVHKGTVDLCSLSQAGALSGAEAPALCHIEFWLNRYQTLIAALIALGAAMYAGRAAWSQLQATERQLAVLLGDLPPDIWVDWEWELDTDEGRLEPAILTVQNLNRRGLRVRRIQLLEPRNVPIWVYDIEKKADPLPADRPDPSTWDIEYRIPGRGVGEGPAQTASFFIRIWSDLDETHAGKEERVKFLVEYDLLGAPGERHQVEVPGWIMRRELSARRVG